MSPHFCESLKVRNEFTLTTYYSDVTEYFLYKRVENNFTLIDFFQSYHEACEEAKQIIENTSSLRNIFTSDIEGGVHAQFAKND